MKFTVEVDDFYLDEEGDLAPQLEKNVTIAVVKQIQEQINKKVDEAIRISVQAKVEKELHLQINTRIAEMIASEKITRDKKEILISDYIKEQFEKNTGWNPSEMIAKKAKEFGDEMKKRYDFLYANLIVTQMHNIGIIKEEIYTNLIENKK